jgi:electron transfer flavoprotein alpha subunit
MDYWNTDSGWSMGSSEPATTSGGGVLAIVFSDSLNAGRALLASARQIADELVSSVSVALFDGDEAAGNELVKAGADSVYLIASDSDTLMAGYPEAIAALGAQLSPSAILLTSGRRGDELAGLLAGRLGGTLVVGANVLSVDYSDQSLIATQPVYGGAALASWKLAGKPQIVTLRPGTASPMLDKSRSGKAEAFSFSVPANSLQISKSESPALPQELNHASVIIAGGYGAGAEGFKLIGELAALLGGTVGATKSAVREGWAEPAQQIGMLGATVKPRLYIAIGISGTPEHLMGITEGATIVAINRDSRAPIFAIADYGIVGDLHEALPAFIARLKKTQ